MNLLCQDRQRLRRNIIVAVHKKQIFAFRRFQPRVARGAKTAVGLVDGTHPLRELRGVLVAKGGTFPVRRAVVHQNNFKIIKILPQKGIHTFGKIIRNIVHRNYNAKKHTVLLSVTYRPLTEKAGEADHTAYGKSDTTPIVSAGGTA